MVQIIRGSNSPRYEKSSYNLLQQQRITSHVSHNTKAALTMTSATKHLNRDTGQTKQ